MKKYQKLDCQSEAIFLMINPMTIPLLNLYEGFMNLFDEPENVISSESILADNKEDE